MENFNVEAIVGNGKVERKKIELNKLKENVSNPYELNEIEQLAESIKKDGLLQQLIVVENKDDTYTIVGGHRRYNAMKYLLDRDMVSDDKIDCKIIEGHPEDIRRVLHTSNLTSRNITNFELLKAYEEVRKFHILEDMAGKKLDNIASIMSVSNDKAYKLDYVFKNANDDQMQEIKKDSKTFIKIYNELKKLNEVSLDDQIIDEVKKITKKQAESNLLKLKTFAEEFGDNEMLLALDEIEEMLVQY